MSLRFAGVRSLLASFTAFFRDGVDERLILPGMCTAGDGERLPMRLLDEFGRAHVGQGDLDRPQALLTERFPMRTDPPA